jgi:hypothetical protein
MLSEMKKGIQMQIGDSVEILADQVQIIDSANW